MTVTTLFPDDDSDPSRRGKYRFAELGRTGLRRDAHYILEEYLPQLQGTQGIKVYREMSSNDPVVGSLLFAIDKILRQVEWRVEPATQRDDDVEAATFVEECMGDMSHTWADFISEVLSMLVYGWSAHEIVYKQRIGPSEADGRRRSKYSDGRVGWRKMPVRSQDSLSRWDFSPSGSVQGMWQIAPPLYTEVYMPIDKMLLFKTQSTKGSPEGRSVLRNAYRPWYMKKRIEEIEAIGIERDLAGLPVAYVDPRIMRSDALDDEKALFEAIKEIVVNIRRDQQEGVVFPRVYDAAGNLMYELTLLSTGGQRQFDTDKIVARYDQRIAMTVLADFILLGHERVGSFALSSDKTDLFAVALGAWLDSISQVLNDYAVPRLFEVNGFSLERLPRIEPGDIEQPDLQKLGDYISKLTAAGWPAFPDPELDKYLREAAGLPERPDDLQALQEKADRLRIEAEYEGLKTQAEMASDPMAQFGVPMGNGMAALPGGGAPPPGGGGQAGPQVPRPGAGGAGGAKAGPKAQAGQAAAEGFPSPPNPYWPKRLSLTKHYPGQHDQSTHGNWARRSGGTAFSINSPSPAFRQQVDDIVRRFKETGLTADTIVQDAYDAYPEQVRNAVDAAVSEYRAGALAEADGAKALLARVAKDVGGGEFDYKIPGTNNTAFDFAVKGEGSLRRKIVADMIWKQSFDPSVASVKDALRFTFLTSGEEYGERGKQVVEMLEANGWEFFRGKNFWTSGDAYQGYNAVFRTPGGVFVEMQVHTPESMHAKETVLHPVYEVARLEPFADQSPDVRSTIRDAGIPDDWADQLTAYQVGMVHNLVPEPNGWDLLPGDLIQVPQNKVDTAKRYLEQS